MSYWNYRIVVNDNVKTISEVYYNNDDSPFGYSDAVIQGETEHELQAELDRFQEAFKYEWLYYPQDFISTEKDEQEHHGFRDTVGRFDDAA